MATGTSRRGLLGRRRTAALVVAVVAFAVLGTVAYDAAAPGTRTAEVRITLTDRSPGALAAYAGEARSASAAMAAARLVSPDVANGPALRALTSALQGSVTAGVDTARGQVVLVARDQSAATAQRNARAYASALRRGQVPGARGAARFQLVPVQTNSSGPLVTVAVAAALTLLVGAALLIAAGVLRPRLTQPDG